MRLYWVALKAHLGERDSRFYADLGANAGAAVITMTLYFIIFGNLVGSLHRRKCMVLAMQFIVPGLIMMAVITNSTRMSRRHFSAKFQPVLRNCWSRPCQRT